MLDQNLQLPVADPGRLAAREPFRRARRRRRSATKRASPGARQPVRADTRRPVPDNLAAARRRVRPLAGRPHLEPSWCRRRSSRRGRNAAPAAPDPGCPAAASAGGSRAAPGPRHRSRPPGARSAAGWSPTASTAGSCSTPATASDRPLRPGRRRRAAAMVRRAEADDAAGTSRTRWSAQRRDRGIRAEPAEHGAGYLRASDATVRRDTASSPPVRGCGPGARRAGRQAAGARPGGARPVAARAAVIDMSLGRCATTSGLRTAARTDKGDHAASNSGPARQPARGRRRPHRLLPAARRRNGTDFSRFYATPWRPRCDPRPAMDTITVVEDPDATPLVVTMLVDPRCAVHATTGILPVKSLAVPGEIATRAWPRSTTRSRPVR